MRTKQFTHINKNKALGLTIQVPLLSSINSCWSVTAQCNTTNPSQQYFKQIFYLHDIEYQLSSVFLLLFYIKRSILKTENIIKENVYDKHDRN